MMNITIVLLWLLLLGTIDAATHSSIARKRGGRHEFAGTRKKATSEVTPGATNPCNGVPVVPNHRRACNFYIWDGPSALFYKWCHHLLKDNLYEGKGGHMFVRYESNSILQLLYPCSRYSPNRCLVCGGSFPDHLELWWSKHMYTPYDRHLDTTYNEALVLNDNSNRGGNKSRSRKSQIETTIAPSYAFHRGYVLDVSRLLFGDEEGQIDDRQRNRRVQRVKQKVSKDKTWSGGSRLRVLNQFSRVAYVVPDLPGEDGKRPSFLMRSVRAVVMHAIDSLLLLQEKENRKLRS